MNRGNYPGATPITWRRWYPTVSQPGVLATTVNYARFLQQGKTITANFDITLVGAGTSPNNVLVSLPVFPYAQPAAAAIQLGSMMIYDASTTTRYNGNAELVGNFIALSYNQASASLWGTVPNLALAAGDILRGTIIYEAA